MGGKAHIILMQGDPVSLRRGGERASHDRRFMRSARSLGLLGSRPKISP
ncbi:MAG: hypothetical protein LBU73_07655 [Helicobacteraceae bacterium]|nr:hypothetical protein [Helicobacteraceae bacterium]